MSLFSDQARAASPGDLAGLLCAQGRVQGGGGRTAARVSIVLGEQWRTGEIGRACAERGLPVARGVTQVGHHSIRTAFVAGLLPLATAWTRGAVKSVPQSWQLDGAALRLWVLAAGAPDGRSYLLGLDPHAPGTHAPLVSALAEVGVTAARVSQARGPALRVSGRRRLTRLAELVGEAPPTTPSGLWPG